MLDASTSGQKGVASQPDLARQMYGPVAGNRWVQLIAGIAGMIVISNYQYAFTLFTPGLIQQFPDAPYSQIAGIFSLFILFETLLLPVSGYLVGRFGIRKLMITGSIGILLGWVLGGTVAKSVFELCIYYGFIGGTAAGLIWIATVANAVKWFPDRRGLAVGLTAAAFGGGAALTLIPINATVNSLGWANAMAVWGAAHGTIAVIAALISRYPPGGWIPAGWQNRAGQVTQRVGQTKTEYPLTQTLRRPEFYLMYLVFLFGAAAGSMTTGNLYQVAKFHNVFDAKIFGIAVVPFTATIAGIMRSLSMIIWGAISDKFGREYTMACAFALEALVIFLVTQITGHPLLFILLLPLVGWRQIEVLFLALTADVFGPKNVTANYSILCTANSIPAGFVAALVAGASAGSFQVSYYVAATCAVVAAALALFVLRPVVRSRIARDVTK